jgi:hypothetical protein
MTYFIKHCAKIGKEVTYQGKKLVWWGLPAAFFGK